MTTTTAILENLNAVIISVSLAKQQLNIAISGGQQKLTAKLGRRRKKMYEMFLLINFHGFLAALTPSSVLHASWPQAVLEYPHITIVCVCACILRVYIHIFYPPMTMSLRTFYYFSGLKGRKVSPSAEKKTFCSCRVYTTYMFHAPMWRLNLKPTQSLATAATTLCCRSSILNTFVKPLFIECGGKQTRHFRNRYLYILHTLARCWNSSRLEKIIPGRQQNLVSFQYGIIRSTCTVGTFRSILELEFLFVCCCCKKPPRPADRQVARKSDWNSTWEVFKSLM